MEKNIENLTDKIKSKKKLLVIFKTVYALLNIINVSTALCENQIIIVCARVICVVVCKYSKLLV